jgi:hypothetical protein
MSKQRTRKSNLNTKKAQTAMDMIKYIYQYGEGTNVLVIYGKFNNI